ncbi:MAG: DUF2236 domain-containing protein [Polyangiaceae bacterium]|nr:DUF2236 domain-containing protein [Polyangiaceae bacterium]
MTVSRDDLEQMLSDLRVDVKDPRAGIFGPESQAWAIDREAAIFIGAGRAALLQTAHPFVAHAVDQHSATKTDPLGRFQRTFDNVFAMVFGDLDQAIRSSRRVHNIHRRIVGAITETSGRFPKGTSYEANNEEALFWVHATLVETAVMVYELFVKPLRAEEKERYYQETMRFARLFGIPDRVMPATFELFMEYNRAMWEGNVLHVGTPALEVRKFLFAAPKWSRKPLFKWLERMTAGLMPDRLGRLTNCHGARLTRCFLRVL